ncbi:MAG: DUF1501 domain-containing protein [Phycisphaeraceae bacterium]
MFSISDPLRPGRLSRRRFIQMGTLGLGLTLPRMLRAESQVAATQGRAKRAKSVILIFCNGGPAHQDTFDLKPDAPSDIAGPFRPIRTAASGMQICELLPKLATCAKDFSLIRTVSHTDALHPSATYWALTGHQPPRSTLDLKPSPTHMPAVGSVLAKYLPSRADLPSYVLAPQLCYDVSNTQPGQHACMLGGAFDPFLVEGDPSSNDFHVRGLSLNDQLTLKRLRDRENIRRSLETHMAYLGQSMEAHALDAFHEQAYSLLSSPAAKRAFDLDEESKLLRDRYGRNRYGQSYLLARRLVEAGVRTVMINDNIGSNNDRWDTHGDNYGTLRKNLPETDAALSSLLIDLKERGLLDTTLVIWMGEMGRSPKNDHRDHWPQCYSVLLAGGGIQGGQVYGESDSQAAYPKSNACTPGDVLATVYAAMGLPKDMTITDHQGRPLFLYGGDPIQAML